MKIGFLYGGQGSQIEKMGLDLYESYPIVREFYDGIELDFPLKEMSFKGSKELIDQTQYTQSLMVAFQIAVTKVLEENNIRPSITAGLSLGEFTSLYAGGVLGEKDLLELVRYRSLKMEDLSKKVKSRMIAVFSDNVDYLENLCLSISNQEAFAQVTNINTRSQIVVSGEESKVEEVESRLEEEGIRYIRLNTSGPFHTSYMDSVAESLGRYLERLSLRQAKIPIIHNLYGEKRDDIDLVDTLSRQVSNRVLFKDSLENILKEDLDILIEIGYGNVIKGFVKRIDRKARVISINSASSINLLLEEVENYD